MCGFGLCLGDGRRRQMMRCWGDQQLATKQWKEDDEMCGFGGCGVVGGEENDVAYVRY